jgi:hypothetical protein
MAEDLATRVPGAEALPPELRERVERAAARFGSIHERWSSLEPARDAVSVTPILGIDTEDSDEAGRPRFKTLMGVPRSSPEIDELAGLDPGSEPRESAAAEPPQPRPAASSDRASPRLDEAPSLAGTSMPWDPGAPPPSSRGTSAAPWPSLAQSSLDVSAEVAALRTASRRRTWWVGLGTIAAAAAIFAIAAPRQRTQALRWLQSEYQARQRPTAAAILDAAEALRPRSTAATASPSDSERGTAQLEPPWAVAQQAAEEATADAPRAMAQALAAPSDESTEELSGGAAGAKLLDPELSPDTPARGGAPDDPGVSSGVERSDRKAKQAGRDARAGGTTTKPRTRVAAARKASQRDDNRPNSSATKAAAGMTKARSTRQNTPRKSGGGGIIRETPF